MIELNRKGDALTKELGFFMLLTSSMLSCLSFATIGPDGARDGTRCLMLSYAWGPLAPGIK